MVLKTPPNSAPVSGSISMDETTMSGLREIARPIASMGDSVKDRSNQQDASSPPIRLRCTPLGMTSSTMKLRTSWALTRVAVPDGRARRMASISASVGLTSAWNIPRIWSMKT